MTNQPYEGSYDGAYDPYQQQHQPQAWPGQQGQQGHTDPHAPEPQYAQQWQGQTWDTQVQPPVDASGTAYPPARPYGVTGAPLPAEAGQQAWPAPPQPAGTDPASAHGPAPAYGAAPGHGPAPAYGTGHGAGPAAFGPTGSGPGADAGAAAPAPAPAPAAGYGPATVAGNARVTDAQRARLEGRSPVIEPGMRPAALTALLALLLALTAPVGSWALLVPLVALQGLTAAGWFRLNGMWPARQGIALAFLGALVADAALLAAGRSSAPAAILGTIGVWVLLTLVLQLRSHADPDERMYGLMATVVSAALAIMATAHLGASAHAVSVGGAAVAVAVLARALPLPTPASVIVSLLAAAGAGIAVGGMTGLGAKGALLGAGAAACALIGHRVASYDYPSRFVHFTAGVALPLTAAAPAVYVLGRALG